MNKIISKGFFNIIAGEYFLYVNRDQSVISMMQTVEDIQINLDSLASDALSIDEDGRLVSKEFRTAGETICFGYERALLNGQIVLIVENDTVAIAIPNDNSKPKRRLLTAMQDLHNAGLELISVNPSSEGYIMKLLLPNNKKLTME